MSTHYRYRLKPDHTEEGFDIRGLRLTKDWRYTGPVAYPVEFEDAATAGIIDIETVESDADRGDEDWTDAVAFGAPATDTPKETKGKKGAKVADPVVPVVEAPVVEPVVETVGDPVAEPVSEPSTEPVAEPAVDPVTETPAV